MDISALRYALDNGIVDYNTIQVQIEKMKRQKYLDNFEYSVWQDPSGRWSTYLPDKAKGRKLVKRKSKEDIENVIIEYVRSNIHFTVFGDVFKQWIERKIERMEIQLQSKDRYTATYDRHIKGSALEQVEFDEITSDILDEYVINTIKDKQLTAKEWANLRLIIRGTFKYAHKRGMTDIRIDEFISELELSPNIFARKRKTDQENVFTDAELRKISKYILSQRPLKVVDLGILLSLETGLRAGELIALRYSDFDEENCVLNVGRTEVRTKTEKGYEYKIRDFTKGKVGYRTVVLLDNAVTIIKLIHKINPNEYLFKEPNINRQECVFTNRLYRICDALDIPKRSLHKCRKTYATKMINSKVPDILVTSQLGHTDITTTRNYYYFNNMEIKEEREILRKCMC